MSKRLTEEQKAANKAARMLKQEKKSWAIYKRWQGENIGQIRAGQEIRSFKEFQTIYNDESVKRDLRVIKNEVRYLTDYNTYRRARKAYREQMRDVEGWEFDESEFNRQMSTRELAALIQTSIEEFREKRLQDDPNMIKAQLAKEVSAYFFGS